MKKELPVVRRAGVGEVEDDPLCRRGAARDGAWLAHERGWGGGQPLEGSPLVGGLLDLRGVHRSCVLVSQQVEVTRDWEPVRQQCPIGLADKIQNICTLLIVVMPGARPGRIGWHKDSVTWRRA